MWLEYNNMSYVYVGNRAVSHNFRISRKEFKIVSPIFRLLKM